MADLKETLYRKLFNVALTNIETVKVEDKSIERVKLSVEAALQFLQQSKDYPPHLSGASAPHCVSGLLSGRGGRL